MAEKLSQASGISGGLLYIGGVRVIGGNANLQSVFKSTNTPKSKFFGTSGTITQSAGISSADLYTGRYSEVYSGFSESPEFPSFKEFLFTSRAIR